MLVCFTNPLYDAFLTVSCRGLQYGFDDAARKQSATGTGQDDLGRVYRESQCEISGTETVREGARRPEFDQQ